MNCDGIKDLLALGAGGEITDHERIAVEAHIAVCAECARELADYRGLVGNLALLREGEAPAGTAERIWEGVRPSVPGRKPRVFALGWIARAAAVLVIGLSVGFTAMSVTRTSSPAPDLSMDGRPVDNYSASYVTPIGHPASKASGGEPGDILVVPPSVVPAEGVNYYLPRADAIISPDDIRF